VHLLLTLLHQLVDAGNCVVLVEHNLEVILHSDYIIDIGPEAGEQGGEIVAQGTPEEIMAEKKSLTGIYLKNYLQKVGPLGQTTAIHHKLLPTDQSSNQMGSK
ncbi:MAG: hypothetical protein K1X29_10220, partial [Bdellovibrionales bacterium]|nr:hypothetical protein [Bdellovibrionales bacterium]